MTTTEHGPQPLPAPEPPAAGTPRKRPSWLAVQLRKRLPGLLSLIALIGIWQLAIVVFRPSDIVLPGPGQVWTAFLGALEDGSVAEAVSGSAGPLAIGMAFAMLAIPVGLAIGMSPVADLITSPYLWGFFALPNIAFAPVLILITGLSNTTRIWMVVLSAAVPLCLSCKDGVQTVDASLVRAARAFGASRMSLFLKVIVPCSLPFIASGVRNAISRGFVGLVSVELLVGIGGSIGGEVRASMRTFDTARGFAFIILLITIALVLVSASRYLEVLASRWREEVVL
ncbi:MAG: ABC transporter permease subunit [Actinobacteria bacterium]|nr:ABC transporter permease subunit [Actinomycetota bacterium]